MSEAAILTPKAAHKWDRADLEWYVEPEAATEALLTKERFSGRVLDPCCGQCNIVRALKVAGYDAIGMDITDRTDGAPWFLGESDFLQRVDPVENICMNPPFFRAKGTEQFIRHALTLATAKVAVFTDIKFLAGFKRASGLFSDHPPHRIWVVTPRVSCPPGEWLLAGNKAGGGTADWCWLVWDQTTPWTSTSFGWARHGASKE